MQFYNRAFVQFENCRRETTCAMCSSDTRLRCIMLIAAATAVNGCVVYNQKLNIAVVLDTAKTVSGETLQILKSYFSRFASCLNIGPEGNRIAMARIIDQPNLLLSFNATSTLAEVRAVVSKMQYIGSSLKFHTPDAMLYANETIFNTADSWPRKVATNILLIMKFTPTLRTDDVIAINRDFAKHGIHTFTLTVGEVSPPIMNAKLWHTEHLQKPSDLINFDGLTQSLMQQFKGCSYHINNTCELLGCSVKKSEACTCDNGWHGTVCELQPSGNCTSNYKFQQDSSSCVCLNPAILIGNATTCPTSPACNHTGVQCHASKASSEILCGCGYGYYGNACETKHRCMVFPNPCKHGGVCKIVSDKEYNCSCVFPYSGDHCQDCVCQNGGKCLTTNGSASCMCRANCTGQLCENCACEQAVCYNGGICENLPGSNYKCKCSRNCGGKSCTECWDFCTKNPQVCLNEGTCLAVKDSYRCICKTGCRGQNCSTCDTVCQRYPTVCRNGGVCSSSDLYNFNCTCINGCYGVVCQWCNSCYRNPGICQNNGTCVDLVNGNFKCSCREGCSGVLCESCLDYCQYNLNPCQNSGVCHSLGRNSYSCNCTSLCYGRHCQKCNQYCNENSGVCKNGGSCVNIGFNGYRCICSSSCTGLNCNTCTPDCMSSACLNASICNTRINGGYSCVCASGCPSCESCDPCTPNPCLNNGQCIVLNPLKRKCKCTLGYHGVNCKYFVPPDSNEYCKTSPCINGCTCNPSEEHSMGYYCHGDAGYLGKNCEISPPSLECSPGTIDLEVPEEIVTTKYLKGTKVYIAVGDVGLSHQNADPVCFSQAATNGKYKITIPIPFLNCNNMIADSPNGEQVISNTIWLNKEEPNRAFDVPVPIGTFKCRYSKDYQVITSLSPVVSNPQPVTRKLNSFSSRFVLCKIPLCPTTCPVSHVLDNTAVYTAGELIYVHMYHKEAIQQNHFSLESLFLSCSPTNFNNEKINLVLNGCSVGESGKLLDFTLQQTNPSTVCLSFRAPIMKVCNTIYIHALVKRCRYGIIEACPGDAVTKRCRLPLRGKRSFLQKQFGSDQQHMITGPLFVVMGSEGYSSLNFNLDRYDSKNVSAPENLPLISKVKVKDWDTTYKWALGIMCAAMIIISIVMAMTLALVKRFRRHVLKLNY